MASAAPSTVDAAALVAWLGRAVEAGGTAPLWPAWTNPARPGFAYEEATAWVLRLARRSPALLDRSVFAAPLARAEGALQASVAATGALRAQGRSYAFDSAVGLAALSDRPSQRLLQATVARFVRERRAVEGGPRLGEERPDVRWSEAFGAHLLWMNLPLRETGEHALADDLTALVLPRVVRDDGLLRIHGASDRVYAHALAYALEGLAVSGEEGKRLARRGLEALLAGWDGAGPLSAWVSGDGPRRADATAQAATLARRLLPDGDAIAARLLSSLSTLQGNDGGLRYETGSEDRNTCAAVFAIEAIPA